MPSPYLSAFESLFWPDGSNRDYWMIVDGARDREVYSQLTNSYLDYSCLYAGELSADLERASPYLVQLEFEDRYTRRLLNHALGNNWGVFLKCAETMSYLRRHLRKFLRVRDPRGNFMAFRYYDPRVLRVYLPTCTPEELKFIFGPIQSFYIEDEDPSILWDCRRSEGRLAINKITLEPKEAAV